MIQEENEMNKGLKKVMVGALVLTLAGSNVFPAIEIPSAGIGQEVSAKTTLKSNKKKSTNNKNNSKKKVSDKKKNKNNNQKNKNNKNNNNKKPSSNKSLTAAAVLKKMKAALKDVYTCSVKQTAEDALTYYDLDKTKVESVAYEQVANSSIQMDVALIVKVKSGYAKTGLEKVKKMLKQTADYSKMYNMDSCRVQQARLYQNGNYIGLFILGKISDSGSAQTQTAQAKKNAEKVDAAWKTVTGGNAKNLAGI